MINGCIIRAARANVEKWPLCIRKLGEFSRNILSVLYVGTGQLGKALFLSRRLLLAVEAASGARFDIQLTVRCSPRWRLQI